MKTIDQRLIIVTPVFEDATSFGLLMADIAKVFGSDIFIVAVDDGSVSTPLQIDAIKNIGLSGTVVRLRRNVGHQRAIAIGLYFVSTRTLREDARIVVMDADGEDRPSDIIQLLDNLDNSERDIVAAGRSSRVASPTFKIFYFVYKCLFRVFSGRRIDFGNFMVMTPFAMQRLCAMHETCGHLAGAVLLSKLRIKTVFVHRGPRYAGNSQMSFVSLALHGFRGLMTFAEDVLVRIGTLCALIAASTVSAGLIAAVLKLTGYATPGWFSITLGLLTLLFFQVGTLTLVSLIMTAVVRTGPANHQTSHRENIAEYVATQPISDDKLDSRKAR
jgi:polyisoprenyl-phosphate glycosyltransferase